MEFASSKAYISKSKIKMGSLSQPESKEESKLPSKPVIPPAKEALSSEKDVSEQHQAHPIPSMPLSSPAYFAKDLGVINEEKEEDSISFRKSGRKASFCSIEDRELDAFHSDEEEVPEKMPDEQEPQKESSGGFFGMISSMFGGKKSTEESKAKKMKKADMRKQEHYKRKNRIEASSMPASRRMAHLSEALGSKEKKYNQEIDTNVMRINLNVLKNMGSLATGDPVFCSKCKAILNMRSKIEENADKQQIWTCEFCNNPNPVLIEEEEKITKDDVTFVLESAAQSMMKKGGGDNISIVFCMDISGSMCVTQPVEGGLAVKYDKVKKMQDLMKFSDGSYQYMEGERSGQKYVSRMQCVQVAIEQQLQELAHGSPGRRVGLVTFNNDVTLIGDGTIPSKVITGDKLNHYDELLENAMKDATTHLSQPIETSFKSLIKKMEEVEETGQTALGPALLLYFSEYPTTRQHNFPQHGGGT